jgi:hypothetical protein
MVIGFTHLTEYLEGKKKVNSGICVKGGCGGDYYEVLKEIIKVQFIGYLVQKTVLLKCEWFDPDTK